MYVATRVRYQIPIRYQMVWKPLCPTALITDQKTRGNVRVFVLVQEKVTCSRGHWVVGRIEQWEHVGRGACAVRRNARYLKPKGEISRWPGVIMADKTNGDSRKRREKQIAHSGRQCSRTTQGSCPRSGIFHKSKRSLCMDLISDHVTNKTVRRLPTEYMG